MNSERIRRIFVPDKRFFSGGGFVRLPVLWVLLSVAVLAGGAFFGHLRMREADRSMREELLRQTRLLTETIQLDQVRALSGTGEDLLLPEYRRFKEQFRYALQAFPRSKFLTLVGRRPDGTVFFYADSELPGSEDESPPGDVYEEMDPGFLPAFEEKRPVTVGPITDRWGTWVSTWHPVSDPATGETVAVLALDIDGGHWRGDVLRASLLPNGTALLLAAVLLCGGFILQRRSRMEEAGRRRFRHAEALLALAAGLVLSLSFARLAHEKEFLGNRHSFSVIADARSGELHMIFDTTRNMVLESLGRFIETERNLSVEHLERFIDHLEALPEVISVAWIPDGPEANGLSSAGAPLSSRRMNRSQGEEPGAAGAMRRAAESGLPSASDIFDLPEGAGRGRGLTIYRPVFSGDGSFRLRGFAAVTLGLDVLLARAQRGGETEASMALWQLGEEKPLFAAGAGSASDSWEFSGVTVSSGDSLCSIRPIFAFGRTFAAEMRPGESFHFHHPIRAGWMALVTGLFITLSVTVLVWGAFRGREALELAVERRTAELRESEARFRSLVEDVPFPVAVISPEGRVLFTNSRGEEFFGLKAALTIGKNLLSDLHLLVNPGAFPGFVGHVFASGSLQGREVAFRMPGGESRWGLLSASAISFGGEDAIIIALQDVTDRKAMIDRLQLANQFFRTTTEGIVVTDAEGFIEDGNPALEELTGYTLEEIRGGRPGMFSAQRVHSETSERFWDSLRRNGVWQGEVWNRRKDGEAYPVWLTVTAVKDSEGKVTHYAGVMTNIGDIKMEQQRLSHMAYHDSLTGLPNRYLLLDRLEMVIARARRERSLAAAVFIDLDEFKEVNDTYGHETGDLLLVSVARRLTGLIREQDTAARLGGDEFVLVLDGFFSREEVEAFLARIYGAFSEPFPAGGRLLSVHGSIGTALFPDDGSTARELIARADEEMYTVKWKNRERHIS